MKNIITVFLLVLATGAFAQHTLSGRVVDEVDRKPLSGVLVTSQHSKTASLTDSDGKFSLIASDSKIKLIISKTGYNPSEVMVNLPLLKPLEVVLVAKTNEIEEVILSSGYQQISKERATGSYSVVDDKLLRQQVTTGIMERLPAIANGLMLNSSTSSDIHLMVRGLSTIQGPKSPLIVLDDFPYEGNLNNIPPDLVESITILKDAAASSIWGARAANGVIVITTKQGKFAKPLNVELTVNTTYSDKPNLNNIKLMSSSDFIDIEQELFKRGAYNSAINSSSYPVLTPVVDILNQAEKGLMSADEAKRQINLLRHLDIRDQYHKYMYTPSLNQQYALNISAGSPKFNWLSAVGYDKNYSNLSASYERLNFVLENTWKPVEKLIIKAGVNFIKTATESGRPGYGDVKINGAWQIPYQTFADDNGKPTVFFSDYNQRYKDGTQGTGLYDWNYYPLTDWTHSVSKQSSAEITLNTMLQYNILKGLDLNVKYQYLNTDLKSDQYYDEESYYTRNYLNGFAYYETPNNLKWRVPKGGILDKSVGVIQVNNLRGQMNYNYSSPRHEISAIAGAEIRASITTSDNDRLYGFNSIRNSALPVDYLTSYPHFIQGTKIYIANRQNMQEWNRRFISMYANAAYVFDKKYTISGSARRDASNLFGLATNDQWNPFWSAGVSWKASEENFYPIHWLPNLKFRASYGFSGNIDPAMVAATTIVYDSAPSEFTGGEQARIANYLNPSLRWETSRMINFGVDFSSKNNRVWGSIDYFTKKGSNLFGEAPLDYTTGISSMLWNVAEMKGHGLDLELNTKNIVGQSFSWNSKLNFSIYRDEVVDYFLLNAFASHFVHTYGNMVPVSAKKGLPVYSIFAYKWAGLDPQTGDPLGYLDGEVSKDYAAITGSEKGVEDLQYFGSAIPTTYGSLLNSFSYGRFSLDFGVSYKLGYWFRRNSIDYGDLISGIVGHSDFNQRWQKPGDELHTQIPSLLYSSNSSRDRFYSGSSALVEKGDHVRLQYLNIGYEFGSDQWKVLSFNTLRLYCAVNNLGILWSANKHNIDPDHSWGANTLRPTTTYSLGFNLKF